MKNYGNWVSYCIFGDVYPKKRNRSGNISVQIIQKHQGKYVRIKNEAQSIKKQILAAQWKDGATIRLKKGQH